MTTKRNPGGDATGLLQSLGDKNSLGRPENVGGLVRKFITGVLDVVAASSEGKISRELGIATVQANCNYFAGILTGRISSDYTVDGGWFPNGLAAYLRTELETDGDTEEVISSAFSAIATQVFDIIQINDEIAKKSAADDLVKSSIMLLSGIK